MFQLIKNLFLYFFFDISPEVDDTPEENNQKNTLTFSYKKTIITIILACMFFFFTYFGGNDLELLQVLLDQLSTVVDVNLYRDIFNNVQKALYYPENKDQFIHILKEIHKFFLNRDSEVMNKVQFNYLMRKIIEILSK